MIHACITTDNRGDLISVVVDGHADMGLQGAVVACAAVSGLCKGFASALGVFRPGCFEIKIPEPGAMKVRRLKKAGSDGWVQGAMGVLIAGLEGVRQEYPEHLSVKAVLQGESDGA